MKYKSLEITDEEKEALKIYCEWEYTYINLLTSGDIETINKLNNDKLNIFTKDYFIKRMETLKQIYSAMVKYTYGMQNMRITLSRGTNLSEIDYIKRSSNECNKLLSTTTSEIAAKQHSGAKVVKQYDEKDGKNVILWIDITDKKLPFIDVNDILDDGSNHYREDEIIIAPFSKFTNLAHVSSWDGYEYYRTEIENQEFDGSKKEKLNIDEIQEKISSIPELIKQYMESKSKINALENLEKYQTNKKDIEALKKEKSIALENKEKAKETFDEIRKGMVNYAKMICAEAKEKVEKEAQEEEVEIKRAKLLNNKEETKTRLNGYVNAIENSVHAIIENTSKYSNIATSFGLNWDVGVSKENLQDMCEKIQEESLKIADEINGIEIDVPEDKFDEQLNKLLEYQKKFNTISSYISVISESQSNYNDANCSKQILTELNEKVKQEIKKAQIHNINMQIKELEGRKVGFLGKLIGKDKELELKKQQLILRRNLIQLEPIEEKDDCTATEIAAQIIAYKMNNNENSPESLQTTLSKMEEIFDIDNVEVEQIINNQLNAGMLMPIQEEKSIFKRKTNKLLEEANQRLEEEIQELRKRTNVQYKRKNKYKSNPIDEVGSVYHNMKLLKDLMKPNEQRTKQAEKQMQ